MYPLLTHLIMGVSQQVTTVYQGAVWIGQPPCLIRSWMTHLIMLVWYEFGDSSTGCSTSMMREEPKVTSSTDFGGALVVQMVLILGGCPLMCGFNCWLKDISVFEFLQSFWINISSTFLCSKWTNRKKIGLFFMITTPGTWFKIAFRDLIFLPSYRPSFMVYD